MDWHSRPTVLSLLARAESRCATPSKRQNCQRNYRLSPKNQKSLQLKRRFLLNPLSIIGILSVRQLGERTSLMRISWTQRTDGRSVQGAQSHTQPMVARHGSPNTAVFVKICAKWNFLMRNMGESSDPGSYSRPKTVAKHGNRFFKQPSRTCRALAQCIS